jgi:hypothetical protein
MRDDFDFLLDTALGVDGVALVAVLLLALVRFQRLRRPECLPVRSAGLSSSAPR